MNRAHVDRLGIFTSTLCALHCALGALLSAGVAGLMFADERIETGFALVAVTFAVVALTSGFRAHGARLPAILGAIGIGALVASRIIELEVEWAELGLSVSGAALLVSAHATNLLASRRHEDCCADASS